MAREFPGRFANCTRLRAPIPRWPGRAPRECRIDVSKYLFDNKSLSMSRCVPNLTPYYAHCRLVNATYLYSLGCELYSAGRASKQDQQDKRERLDERRAVRYGEVRWYCSDRAKTCEARNLLQDRTSVALHISRYIVVTLILLRAYLTIRSSQESSLLAQAICE